MRLRTTQLRVIEPEKWENTCKDTNLKAAEELQNVDISLYVNRLVNLNATHTSSISHMLSVE